MKNEKRCLLKKKIAVIREALHEKLHYTKEDEYIKIKALPSILSQILFNTDEDGRKTIAFPMKELKKIDLSGISFDDVDVRKVDFTESKGVILNPQTVWDKDLRSAILCDVKIEGSFDDVAVTGVNFTGSKGAILNPQTVWCKDLSDAALCDVKIEGSFDDVDVRKVDFTGNRGAILNPQTVWDKNLSGATLCDVKIEGSFDDVDVAKVDFTGSRGAILNPQTVRKKDLSGATLCDVKIEGSFDGCEIDENTVDNKSESYLYELLLDIKSAPKVKKR